MNENEMTLERAMAVLSDQRERRGTAVSRLESAVVTWATELADRLNIGDTAKVPGSVRVAVRVVGYYGAQGPTGDGWRPVMCPPCERFVRLAVEWPLDLDECIQIIDPPTGLHWFDGRNVQRQIPGRLYVVTADGEIEPAKPATADVLRLVGSEAKNIVAAFAEAVRAEAEATERAAQNIEE